MKSQVPPMINFNLELEWDHGEQAFIQKWEHANTNQKSPRNLEDYFEFLSELLPAPTEEIPKRLADKQFEL
jgi:hypothetical protein